MKNNARHLISAILSLTAVAFCIPAASEQAQVPEALKSTIISETPKALKAEKGVDSVKMPEEVMTAGEIKRIDPETGRVTIRHGEIKNLDMPGMTMVFKVTPVSLAENFQVGDKILFHAEKVGSGFSVTSLKKMP